MAFARLSIAPGLPSPGYRPAAGVATAQATRDVGRGSLQQLQGALELGDVCARSRDRATQRGERFTVAAAHGYRHTAQAARVLLVVRGIPALAHLRQHGLERLDIGNC